MYRSAQKQNNYSLRKKERFVINIKKYGHALYSYINYKALTMYLHQKISKMYLLWSYYIAKHFCCY